MGGLLTGLQGLGQAKPVSEFINTASQYQMAQSTLESQKLMQEKARMEAKQMEKDNKEYDIDAALSLYPEQDRPFVKEALTMSGKVNPNGIVIGKDMREVPKLFEAYPKVAIGRGQMEYESLAKENEKLGKKGDPQSQQQMLSNATRMTEIRKHIQSLSGKDEVDKGFTLGEGQKRFDASGKEVAAGTEKQEKLPKLGDLRKFNLGDKEVTEEWNGTGWAPKAEGPRYKPEAAVNINFDKDVVKQQIKELPKLKEKARSSKNALTRIDQMLGLLDRGAGGRLGQAKAWVAPYAEAFGFSSKGMTEATLYERLARTQGGSMRMEVIGPGQVSDYENRLMREISGGGETAASAARELLVYYRGLAESNINDYNTAAGSVGDVSPASKKANPPIGIGAPPEKKRYKFNPATGQLE